MFKIMTTAHFEALCSVSYHQTFPANTTILHEDDFSDFLYFLNAGSVEISASFDDKETIIDCVSNQSFLKLNATLSNSTCSTHVKTLERSEVFLLQAKTFRAAIREDIQLALMAIQELTCFSLGLFNALKNQKLLSGPQRLASTLIKMREDLPESELITLPYEKRVLASLLGMTPENLSRSIQKLATHGIEFVGNQFRIFNNKAVREFTIDNHLGT